MRWADYASRIAICALSVYMLAFCPLDTSLVSQTCKTFYLYRRYVILPVGRTVLVAVQRAALLAVLWAERVVTQTKLVCEDDVSTWALSALQGLLNSWLADCVDVPASHAMPALGCHAGLARARPSIRLTLK